MSNGIPLIQPSTIAPNLDVAASKRSIFSAPTVDLNASIGMVQHMDKDQNDDEYVAMLHLDPSPIAKGVSAEAWAKTNRTLRSTFRPTTNEIAVYVAGRKAAEEVRVAHTRLHNSISLRYSDMGPIYSSLFRDRSSY